MTTMLVAITVNDNGTDEDRDNAEDWLRGYLDNAEAVRRFEFMPVKVIDPEIDPERDWLPFATSGEE